VRTSPSPYVPQIQPTERRAYSTVIVPFIPPWFVH